MLWYANSLIALHVYAPQEVEFLQRNSKMQDVTKNNSTRYYNNSNDKMIPTVRPQTVKQQERILKCKDKSSTVLMEKDMPIKTESITKSCNEEGLITKPKGFSITNSYKKEALVTKPKSFSNLVCNIIYINVFC